MKPLRPLGGSSAGQENKNAREPGPIFGRELRQNVGREKNSLGGGAKLVAPREWDFINHFLDCGTNLRTETCLYTKSAKKRRGVGGQEWRGREATKEGCTAAAPIVRPQMEYL